MPVNLRGWRVNCTWQQCTLTQNICKMSMEITSSCDMWSSEFFSMLCELWVVYKSGFQAAISFVAMANRKYIWWLKFQGKLSIGDQQIWKKKKELEKPINVWLNYLIIWIIWFIFCRGSFDDLPNQVSLLKVR